MIYEEKQRLRELISQKMSRLTVRDIEYASQKMRTALERWPRWREARSACVFCASSNEPDLLDPWPSDKILAFPRVEGLALSLRMVAKREELVRGAFGIWEPSEDAPLGEMSFDVILVPGIAFDQSGARLGRGGGYYDRLLATQAGFRVGVCFDEQIQATVPCEPHDERMDALLTTSGVVLCEPKNKR